MIELKNVCKKLKQDFAVNIGHLAFNDGELCVVKGKNGSGKSTLFRMISDIIPLDRGKILIDNKSHFSETAQSCLAGFLGTERLVDFLTPKEYFFTVGKSYGLGKEEIAANYERINSFFAREYFDSNKLINTFSDGNRQLIGVYAAFIPGARHVYLDEPLNFLDKSTVDKMYGFISDYKKTKNHTIIISDNTDQLVPLADRVIMFDNGSCVTD